MAVKRLSRGDSFAVTQLMIPRVQENFRFGRTNYQERTMSYLRTPEHRARQAALILTWCPWKKSTGPTSLASKAASANRDAPMRFS